MPFTPPSTTTVNFDSLVSATLNNTRSQRYDQIFRKSVFWAWLHAAGRKEMIDGGVRIQRALDYAVNGTVKSYNGYDPVDLTPQEHITSLLEDLKEVAGSVVISRREERQNSGRAAIINLLSSKVENLDRSFGQKMNEMVLAPTGTSLVAGNSDKDLRPITEWISTAANTVGNIAEASNAFWAPQRQKAGSANNTAQTLSNFKQELRHFYNNCSKHNDGTPDLVLTSQAVAEKYEQSLEGQVRYNDTKFANLGFETVKLYAAALAWDQIVPRSTANSTTLNLWSVPTTDDDYDHIAYFINSQFFKLLVDTQTDLVNRPFMESIDQTAKSALVLFMGQLVCTNRRAQGALYAIDVSAITG
jgi:hypothetical protein